MPREGGAVRELQRLLELGARAVAVARVQQRLAQAHPGERLAADRADLAAEPGGLEQVLAGGLEVAGEQLGLAEQGRGEGLAAARARLAAPARAVAWRSRRAVVGLAAVEHVLGHAQVGVEDAARQLRRVADSRSRQRAC